MQGRNFQNQDLKSQSFRGQDLTGANFNRADIRGADFTNTILRHTTFVGVQAGLRHHWSFASIALPITAGFLIGFLATRLTALLVTQDLSSPNSSISGVIVLVLFAAFLRVTQLQGLGKAIGITLGIAAVLGTLVSTIAIAFDQPILGGITLAVATTLVLSIGSAVTAIVELTTANTIISIGIRAIALISAVSAAIAVVLEGKGETGITLRNAGWSGTITTLSIATVVILWCANISRQALINQSPNPLIRSIAVAIASIQGTRFRGADLTGANFKNALLSHCDFRNAILHYTRWDQARKLDYAQWSDSVLSNPVIRDLLVVRRVSSLNYQEMNLNNTDLSGINFAGADFKRANLIGANLQAACLQDANLTLVQALGANLTATRLTGACIESWVIDHTTQLDNIDCQYVYRLEFPKPETDDRERSPLTGEFAPGDFTKLFQTVMDTIELIFRNGVDRNALETTLKAIQVNHQGVKLKGITDKDDGFIVVTLGIPPGEDKPTIDRKFRQLYQDAVEALETQYQSQLQTAQEQLAFYRQSNTELTAIIKQLLNRHPSQVETQPDKLVLLTVLYGNFEQGFPILAQIWAGGYPLSTFMGHLPAAPLIPKLYQQWQRLYRTQRFCRITFEEDYPVTNFSKPELDKIAKQLGQHLNAWLNSESFRPIDQRLRDRLSPTEAPRIILQTEDNQLRRLPWHLWDLLRVYRKAELALSASSGDRLERANSSRTQIRILAILGNSEGVDVEGDRQILSRLPDAETVFLVEPTLVQLNQALWDQIGWDILCFSGHSLSQSDGSTGEIYINQTDKLSLSALKLALRAAVERGLQLAIFNSCDGLGLAQELATVHIPQVIVMREPVPDYVAQTFLRDFLTAFSAGHSLYVSVRQGRDRLEGLEQEFPYATWLPVIVQNPAELPVTWQNFLHRST